MFQHDNQLCYIFADILVSPSLQFINNLSNQPASKSFSLKSYYFPTQSQFMSFERYFWNVVYYFDEGVGYHHTHFSGPSRAKSASLNVVWIVAHFVSGICSRLGQVQGPQWANRGALLFLLSFVVLSTQILPQRERFDTFNVWPTALFSLWYPTAFSVLKAVNKQI